MSSKSSNNFSIIYMYCITLRNVNINLHFYIRYVNIWIAAFAWANLCREILTLTFVFDTVCKYVDCRIYMGIFILGNISITICFTYGM